MNLSSLKSQYFDGIWQTKAFLVRQESFTLQSGKKSHLYLNHRNFLSSEKYLTLVANIYHELIKNVVDDFQFGAIDSVTSPVIVGAMSALYNKNYVVAEEVSDKDTSPNPRYQSAP